MKKVIFCALICLPILSIAQKKPIKEYQLPKWQTPDSFVIYEAKWPKSIFLPPLDSAKSIWWFEVVAGGLSIIDDRGDISARDAKARKAYFQPILDSIRIEFLRNWGPKQDSISAKK